MISAKFEVPENAKAGSILRFDYRGHIQTVIVPEGIHPGMSLECLVVAKWPFIDLNPHVARLRERRIVHDDHTII